MIMAYPIGWFSTGRDEAARILFSSVNDNKSKLGIEIAYVFCNRERSESPVTNSFLSDVLNANIPLVCFSSKKFREKYQDWREPYHHEAMKLLEQYRKGVDIDMFAGYMLYASEEMSKKYRLLNLHPATPWGPKGTWQEVIWELMDTGAEETGVMLHRATKDLDRGPPVTYCKFRIIGSDFDGHWEDYRDQRKKLTTEEMKEKYPDSGYPESSHPLFVAIREAGFKREIPALLHTIGEFAKHNVEFQGDFVISHGKTLGSGHDITELVDQEMEKS